MIRFPGALLSAFYGDMYGGKVMSTPLEKLVLHSTETRGLPGYRSGKSAPNLTVDPWRKKVWEHYELNRASRALRNPSWTPVSENQDGVCQIEIVGYTSVFGKVVGRYLMDLPADNMVWLGAQVAKVLDLTGVPEVWADPWDAPYGDSPLRFSSAEYDAFRGILPHARVSGNTHYDPRLNVSALKSAVAAARGRRASRSDARPAGLVVDGRLGPKTITRWQQVMGTPADGVVSRPSTLVRAVQRALNTRGARDENGRSLVVDGLGVRSNLSGAVGPTHTIYALQRYLGTVRDGVLSYPTSKAVAALQRRLNTGRF